MKNKFILFLEKNNIKSLYFKNLLKGRKRNFDIIVKIVDPEYWVDGAFIWPLEEFKFWEELNEKWLNYIYHENKN